MTPAPYRNIHGRRPTRGLRPWLLIPKILAVAVYFGGLTAATVLWETSTLVRFAFDGPGGALGLAPGYPPNFPVEELRLLFRWVIVPALIVAIALGVLLLMQHPRQFIRLRWLQVKLATLALGLPLGHWFFYTRLIALHRFFQGDLDVALAQVRQIAWGLPILIAASAWVIVLGRLKPRLGQNWAQASGLTGKA